MTGLSDSFNRPINYLRISITDRCNLRCIYCFPLHGVSPLPRSEILSYEEIAIITRIAASLGINKVRITGGEPLVRAGVTELVAMLSQIEGIDDLSLTTNGTLLKYYARELKTAGLKRVNVSLDTLRKDRFKSISGSDRFKDVLEGIEAARIADLEPVKINVVLLRGVNDDEIIDLARQTITEGWHVRFIELMPFTRLPFNFIPVAEIRERLSSLGQLVPCFPIAGDGPAKYYCFPGAKGTIGFISPVSEHYCFSCNRLRLTSQGKLRPCLLADGEVDLRQSLHQLDLEKLKELICEAVLSKPYSHSEAPGFVSHKSPMSQIGG